MASADVNLVIGFFAHQGSIRHYLFIVKCTVPTPRTFSIISKAMESLFPNKVHFTDLLGYRILPIKSQSEDPRTASIMDEAMFPPIPSHIQIIRTTVARRSERELEFSNIIASIARRDPRVIERTIPPGSQPRFIHGEAKRLRRRGSGKGEKEKAGRGRIVEPEILRTFAPQTSDS